jgi:plastocyanin
VAGARTLTTTAYSPNPLTITRGTTVTWVNNDTSSHDQVADGGAFNTGLLAPGGQASFTFQNAGAFPYHCGVHPNMVATITVQ